MEKTPTEKASQRAITNHWKSVIAEYQQPNVWRASWQVLNTVGGYIVLWWLMYLSLSVSWWLTVPLAILAGGLLIRAFIIFHARRAQRPSDFITLRGRGREEDQTFPQPRRS